MKTIKLFAAAMLISVASVAAAQSDKDAKACADMAKAKAELLTKELSLSTEQAAKVNDLLTNNEKELVGMRGHCEMMDAKAKKADEVTYASINELLDEKQQARFKEVRASGKLESCGKEGGKSCCAGKGAKAEKAPPPGKASSASTPATKATQ